MVFLITSVMAVVLAVISARVRPYSGIMLLYSEIAVVTTGALLDILIFVP